MPTPDPFLLQFADLLGDRRPRRVLDCGAGAGRNSRYLGKRGHQVVGVDRSAQMLERSRGVSRSALVRGDLRTLPFADAAFDALICTHVLETLRLPAITAAVAEFRRVVRPGGMLLIVTAAREDADPAGGREVEPGTFVFDREGRVSAHLADRTELAVWTAGFATAARYFGGPLLPQTGRATFATLLRPVGLHGPASFRPNPREVTAMAKMRVGLLIGNGGRVPALRSFELSGYADWEIVCAVSCKKAEPPHLAWLRDQGIPSYVYNWPTMKRPVERGGMGLTDEECSRRLGQLMENHGVEFVATP
ncbi:MAG: class I SAM-dependent methyltransferase, partial [Chloroflexi bacterium]|nr:class I SAM-dependent methyltransferase [Chloroflexota bacterium]